MAAGAVSLRKFHDIVILSFCNIVKCQATEERILIFEMVEVYWPTNTNHMFSRVGSSM